MLEESFTVAWWEQRGSGLSYNRSLPRASITTEQLVADTIAVTHHLRERFGQDRRIMREDVRKSVARLSDGQVP